MNRILVPTDFSEQSRSALLAAGGLARRTGAQIQLLHVLEKPKREEEAKQRIAQEGTQPELEGIVIERFVTRGNDVDEIIHFKSDLIVMGSKGARGLRSLILGTHAESVAKHAMVPVITVKHAADLEHVKRIVFATDLRPEQEDILDDLSRFQTLFDAHLHLLKVYDSTVVKAGEVEKRMRSFAENFRLKSYSVTAREGTNEIHEIIAFATEMKADLVAMATHDRHGLERLFGGLISGSVINEIDLPIWTKALPYAD
ncbi:MAG: universal stress protein [Bacteroidota bacterium]